MAAILLGLLALPVISYGVGESFPVVAEEGFVVATRSPLEIVVSARGELEGEDNVYIQSRCLWTTRLLWIAPDGQKIKKGEVVARLDSSFLDEKLKLRQISLVNAEAELQRAVENIQIQNLTNENRLATSELNVLLTQLALDGYRTAGHLQELHSLEAAVALASEDYTRATKKYEYVCNMVRLGYKTPTEREAERLNLLKVTQANRQAASKLALFRNHTHKRKLRELSAKAEEAAAEYERTKLRIAVSNRAREIRKRAWEKSVEILRYDVARYEESIAACTIRAPRSGEVMLYRRDNNVICEGDLIPPQRLLVTLPDRDQLKVSVRLHESKIRLIQEGRLASIRVDAAPGSAFAGEISRVSSVPLSGRFPNFDLREYALNVSLTVDAPGQKGLSPGMTAAVDIIADSRADALVVPVTALVEVGGEMFAFKRRGDDVLPERVEVGLVNGTSAEILSGLEVGDQVVLRPRITCARRILALQTQRLADARTDWTSKAL